STRQAPWPQGGPVTPWKPPVDDPFLRALQTQARPAGLGRRLVARIIDSIVPVAAAAAVAVPLLPRAVDHIQAKVDAAEQAGVTREIWLLDTTTGGYLAVVLGTLLLTGVLYEALPTARWGRSLGKKLCGVKVLDLEAQTPPGVGAALLRWLLHAVLAVTAVGVVNAAWCLFDKPWRQCWHDKAARTFVAKDSGEALRPG
ncbi:RDD family protein, partial [Streptomyces sparsus]